MYLSQKQNLIYAFRFVTLFLIAFIFFYSAYLQILLNRTYNSQEWCLNRAAKPHAFVNLLFKFKYMAIISYLSFLIYNLLYSYIISQIINLGLLGK